MKVQYIWHFHQLPIMLRKLESTTVAEIHCQYNLLNFGHDHRHLVHNPVFHWQPVQTGYVHIIPDHINERITKTASYMT